MTRVIIASGRDYHFTKADRAWLDGLRASIPITEVVSGNYRGADHAGEKWARERGIPVKLFRADWNAHGRAAGPKRNQAMADYADALIAFQGGAGTRDMIAKARAKGISVFERANKGGNGT